MRKIKDQSRRLQAWDYRNPGAYFITICTRNRQHFFGEFKDAKMQLSIPGAIVQGIWYEIPRHFDHVELGAFVVMPNHVHGILQLAAADGSFPVGTWQCRVPTGNGYDPVIDDDQYQDKRNQPGFYKKIVPKPGSVSVIIGSFKSICTKHIRKTLPDLGFHWQERFHDHIIRDEQSFIRITDYINNNPVKWKEDKFYKIPLTQHHFQIHHQPRKHTNRN